MDKRYQVFVSSTYEDLREERQEVMQALLELDCIPAGMELFPAADDDQWTLIKRVIDDCDYYIVVIGGRYGSIGTSGISYTQMEYEYAILQGKPVIAFLHKDPEALLSGKCEKSPEGKEKLEIFRGLVQRKMCKFWVTPADLGSVVSRSLVKLIKTNPAVGWVKADRLPEESTAEEILRLRKRIEELETQLQQSLVTSPSGTEHLSQGDDLVNLRYSFGAFKTSRFSADVTYSATFETTWNELFSAISPLLVDEASEVVLRKALDGFVESKNLPSLEENEELKEYRLASFSLNDEDFQTVKVQFIALKLMTKSTKKKARSVSDKAAYWMLTPYGESVMLALRAIRRKSEVGPAGLPSAAAAIPAGAAVRATLRLICGYGASGSGKLEDYGSIISSV
jgi:hypothetical protein